MIETGNMFDNSCKQDISMNVVSPISKSNAAVIVRNAYKRYSPDSVLFNGLNLAVQKNTIYGLLGPSGCGKTTLLNCIIGKDTLDAGCISLNVNRRSDIGFMPQKVCLYDRLKISENIFIFGYLLGLTTKEIKLRLEEHLSFLAIPVGDRLVGELSGGEQRRVSLAVVFLHDPKILFLDEPTVGLDAMLSESIWNRLLEMTKTGKTIIITTHYIQEATRAHKVGLMRKGVLLAEESPRALLDKFSTDNLESVFLKLIHSGSSSLDEEKETGFPVKGEPIIPSFQEDRQLFSMSKLKAMNYKNWIMLKREYVFMLLLLLLPISQHSFTNVAIGRKPQHIPIAVINEEVPLTVCSNYQYHTTGCFLEDQTVYLSCLFIDIMKNKSYNLIEYQNNSSAIIDLSYRKVDGILHFGKNYSLSLAQVVEDGFHTDSGTVNDSFVDAFLDWQDAFSVLFVKTDTYDTIREMLARAMTYCDINPNIGNIAFSLLFEKPIIGTTNTNYSDSAAISIFCICAYFFPAILYGGFIFIETVTGMPYRLSVAGVSMLVQTISVILFVMVIHIIQSLEGFVIIFWFFSCPLEGSLITLIGLTIVLGLCGIFFGLFMCSLSHKMTVVAFTVCGFTLMLSYTNGLTWPIDGAHDMLRRLHWLIPLTYESEAARLIALKGLSFGNSLIYRAFISCCVWSVVFIAVSRTLIRRQKGVWTNK